MTDKRLRQIIKETTNNLLNETDWKTSDAAVQKYDEEFSQAYSIAYDLEDVINNIEENKWIPSHMKREFIARIEPVYNYFERKRKQGSNLTKLHNDNFSKQHNGKNEEEFSKGIESKFNDDTFEYENLTPSEKEFSDYKF